MRLAGLTTLILFFGVGTECLAQEPAGDRAENLRMQLLEIDGRENELRSRLLEIEESLKPENISRSLAGVGSTRPEELRTQRRRQLEVERNYFRQQIDLLEKQRSRIQSAILQADNEAYLESAGIDPSSDVAKKKVVRHRPRRKQTKGRKKPAATRTKASLGPPPSLLLFRSEPSRLC